MVLSSVTPCAQLDTRSTEPPSKDLGGGGLELWALTGAPNFGMFLVDGI